MQQEIYIIDDTSRFIKKVQDIFQKENNYHFVSVSSDNIEIVLKNIPTMIIIDDDNINISSIEICKKIRTSEDNSITPILVTSSNSDHDYRMQILNLSVQYYILNPIDNDYFYMTVKNMIEFVTTNRRVSPLTGLPRKCTNTS